MNTLTWSRLVRGGLISVLLVLLGSPSLRAGALQKKIGSDPAELAGRMKLNIMSMGSGSPKGTGPVPYLPALGGPPKRVALVSFYVWDAGNETHSVYNTTMQWSISKTVTGTGRDRVVNALYAVAIQPMKDAFAANGIQLLTPAEYLDTPDKKAAYDSFTLGHGALGSTIGFLTKKNRSEPAAAEGFKLLQLPSNNNVKAKKFELAAQGGDGKLFQGLGHDLATLLQVDAVLVVYSPLQAQSKTIDLLGAYAYLFGPNPVPQGNSTLYWTGHQYSGVYLTMDVPLLEIDRKGTETTNSFDDYGTLAGALALRTSDYVKKRIAGK
ncbi:MAG: hypothetical protein ABIZ04_12275 [Opitutus sp.]